MWVVGQSRAPVALPHGNGTDVHCTGGWVGSTAVCTGAENRAPTGIRSPDCLTRSEALCRLSYPVPT